MMTGLEGSAGCFQPDPLAGADNQYTHDGPVVTELKVSPDDNLVGDAGGGYDAHGHFRRFQKKP